MESLSKETTDISLMDSLTEQDVKDYEAAFAMYDKNSDGRITCTELLYVMRSLGENPTEDEIQNILNEMDLDRNGTIEFHEFLQTMAERKGTDISADLQMAFKVFDTNGDGRVSANELRYAMTSLGSPLSSDEVEELMLQWDADQDGCIDYQEFVKMISDVFK